MDAYLAGGAEALVTHDAHFGVLAEVGFPLVQVLGAEAFHALLREREDEDQRD